MDGLNSTLPITFPFTYYTLTFKQNVILDSQIVVIAKVADPLIPAFISLSEPGDSGGAKLKVLNSLSLILVLFNRYFSN